MLWALANHPFSNTGHIKIEVPEIKPHARALNHPGDLWLVDWRIARVISSLAIVHTMKNNPIPR